MSPKGRTNPTDAWMPPRVYRGKSAFEWRPRGGGCVRLCALDTQREDVWDAYRNAKLARENDATVTIGTMLDGYLLSHQFKSLKPATQKDYRQCEKKIRAVFGKVAPEAITAPIVRQFMDRRAKTSTIRANREKALLSTMWAWNFERGKTAMPNPCDKVKPFKEPPRERYVTDDEYMAVFELAPLHIRIAMEIAYLCAARQGDVLDLRKGRKGQTQPEPGQNAVILDQGLYIRQGKTGKRQIKLWTPRLRAAVKAAEKLDSTISSMFLIHNRHGQRYTASGFKGVWYKTMQAWLSDRDENGKITIVAKANHPSWYTFHDLKAKGISDYEQGDKQEFSGHASRSQMEKYNRRIQEVSALDPEQKK
jgi:hypothetical protein